MFSFSILWELYGLYVLLGVFSILLILYNGIFQVIGIVAINYFIWFMPVSKLDKLASELCSCIKPMTDLMRELREEPQRSEEITRQLTEFQRTPCMLKLQQDAELLEQEFPRDTDAGRKMEEDFKAAVQKKCPEVAEDLGI